jgi:signal transduction histidine kinase
MLTATICASAANAWLAARRTRGQIETQLRDVARTLVESSFPLTDAVLRQTHGLSGAEFAVTDAGGQVVAASLPNVSTTPLAAAPQNPAALALQKTITIDGRTFFHAVVQRAPRQGIGGEQRLHIFYPEEQWRRAWREAVAPPLLVGVVALALMAGLATWLATRFTRPIARLQTQVEQIAQGDFRPLPLPPRNDEIRDLAASVNRMAEMLARYEEEVRRRERLRTLGQLGGGIAHQLRNAVTGCRMALDLYRRRTPAAEADEDLAVAIRQLELMETYLRRFLTLGAEHRPPAAELDLAQVVEDVLPLVRPAADHLGVALHWAPPARPLIVRGDESGLAQLVVNLTLNAIEAASGGAPPEKPAAVEVRVDEGESQSCLARLEIVDNGSGPAADVQDRIFEPLVTDKQDGAGLGLPVAREIAQLHGGDIHWERRNGHTHFVMELPLHMNSKIEVSSTR